MRSPSVKTRSPSPCPSKSYNAVTNTAGALGLGGAGGGFFFAAAAAAAKATLDCWPGETALPGVIGVADGEEMECVKRWWFDEAEK